VILNPEKVRSDSYVQIFHAFCDNTEAYEKRATFIFVMSVPENFRDISDEWETFQNVLTDSWTGVIPADSMAAMTSRIGQQVIALNSTDKCSERESTEK